MVKATVFGAAGGIGQSLSLLLKLDKNLDELSLYDVVNAPGVGQDLSHINTKSRVTSFLPLDDGLQKLLKDTDIVVIPAGVPRKPGMTRDDLFKINGGIIRDLLQGILSYAKPGVFVLVISNPVNSTVPIVAEVLKKNGVYDPARLIGVNTLDLVRADEFITEFFPEELLTKDNFIPIIGGHSGETIVPLYSVLLPEYYKRLTTEQKQFLIHRVQYGGDEVVKLKNGAGSLTLSMAYAGYKIASKFISLLSGEVTEVKDEIAYIDLNNSIKGVPELKKILEQKFNENKLQFISVPISLDKNGISQIDYHVLENCNPEEDELIQVAIEQLKKNITKGTSFITGQIEA